ncbi:helix-turn-helix domain-containing protein [Streptomyces fulvoviolaceus]|uniref:helix-turn-helix domain-containing protein n=1 Tax=Streptomyces fulvoviolaceus TaxID=285535 RepID=UPI0021C17841|nr:helix-turn-helix domain-containing protein [Streptomyces fulvoviolaceus]MCT9078675.1 helix-turn-helix domain-containing protein [Streptomyces fulvoviolaceus]
MDRAEDDHTEDFQDHYPAAHVRELIERQRRRERELSSLYATARSVTVLRGLDEVLASVVENAHDLIGTDIAYLTVLEENGTHLRVRATAGTLTSGFDERVHAPAHVGIAGRVAGTRAPYWESDYLASTEIVHDPVVDAAIEAEGIVSMLGVPLVAGDRFLGTLIAANREERPFVRDDVALLSAFGDHAAVALENARLYDESRRALHALETAYATIKAAEAVHEALTRVVLVGGDVGAVADLVADTLGGGVLVLDHAERVLVSRGQPADEDEAKVRERALLAAAPRMAAAIVHGIEESRRSGRCVTVDRGAMLRHTVAAVMVGATHMGALVLSRHSDPTPVEARTLERAAQTAALLTLTQDAVVRAEERVRGELLTQLLTAPRPFSSELALRARARHIEPSQLDTVLVVDAADGRLSDTTRLLHGIAEEYDGLAGEHLGVPVALIRTRGAQGADQAARSVHQRLRRGLGAPVLVCAAPVPPVAEPLGGGVTLASRCCRLLRGIGVRDGGAGTERLAMYAILFDPDRAQDLESFLEESVGRVVAHDAERGADLLGTLTAYFANSRNVAGTARALHIHTNTLLKRIERIGGLLGQDWQQPDNALRLQLAVHLHDLARQVDQADVAPG